MLYINSDKTNKDLILLWTKYFGPQNAKELIPLFYPPLKTKSLLFIGLNPSFNELNIAKIIRGTKYEGLNLKEFYSWDCEKCDIEKAVAIENEADIKYLKYTGKFKDIISYLSLSSIETTYEHIDLFFARQTSQNNFKERILSNGKLNDFALDQLKISYSLIEHSNPSAIVVVNALSSQYIREYWPIFKNTEEFQEDLGFHTITLKDTKIPIFFSSMLTGQRALDNGSYERLKWHIKKALISLPLS